MLTSPNSLTTTAAIPTDGLASRRFSNVVLPDPRKPEISVTGIVATTAVRSEDFAARQPARDQPITRKIGDHPAAVRRDHDFLLDPRRTRSVGRPLPTFDGEDHSLAQNGLGAGKPPREHRPFPEAQADAMPEL